MTIRREEEEIEKLVEQELPRTDNNRGIIIGGTLLGFLAVFIILKAQGKPPLIWR